MTQPDQWCGTCKWFREMPDAIPYGQCGFVVPECVDDFDKSVMHGVIGGTACPCWEAKE